MGEILLILLAIILAPVALGAAGVMIYVLYLGALDLRDAICRKVRRG